MYSFVLNIVSGKGGHRLNEPAQLQVWGEAVQMDNTMMTPTRVCSAQPGPLDAAAQLKASAKKQMCF